MKTAIALVAVLALASVSYGQAFWSFENDSNGFAAITSFSDTIGVTDGSYSAELTDHGWLAYQNGSGSFVNDMRVNDTVLIDFTRPGYAGQQVMLQLACDGKTWTSGYLPLTGNGATDTIAFEYGDMSMVPENGWGWFKLGLVGGSDPVYMDNVRFVPEPATMALLGLGSVAALIRRRR